MINPEILLASKPVDTLSSATQAQNLTNMGNQAQIQQGVIAQQPGAMAQQAADVTAAQQQNQQRQQQMNLTAAVNDAMKNAWKPGADGAPPVLDIDGLQKALALAGHGAAIPGIMQQVTASQEAASKLASQKATTATAQNDYGGTIGSTIKSAKYSPQLMITALQQGLHAGAIDPNVVNPILQQLNQSLTTDPTGAQATALTQQFADHLIQASPAQQKIIAEQQTSQSKADAVANAKAEKDRATVSNVYGGVKNAADLAAANTQLAAQGVAPSLLAAQYDPADIQRRSEATLTADNRATIANQQKERDQAAANQANTQNYQNRELNLRAQEVGIQGARLNVEKAAADPWGALGLNQHPMGGVAAGGAAGGQGLHGDQFLNTLPTQMAATVKAVAEGRQTNLPRGGKELDQLMGAVNQYDPSYSVQRAQQRTAFTTGAQGKNIGNLNTAVIHLDQYHEVMKAMNNGTFTPGNQVYNWVAQKLGSAAVTNPNFVRQSFAGEAASALKGNATDPEIAHILGTIDPQQSPAQQEGAAMEGLKLFGAKLNTYDEQYHQVSPDDPWSPVLPSAKAVFQRYGISPLARGGAPAAVPAAAPPPPAGGTPPPAKLAAAFQVTATAPNGHRIGSNDGQKTWFDLTTGKKLQ